MDRLLESHDRRGSLLEVPKQSLAWSLLDTSDCLTTGLDIAHQRFVYEVANLLHGKDEGPLSSELISFEVLRAR